MHRRTSPTSFRLLVVVLLTTALLLLLCTPPLAMAVSTSDFTAAQHTNTLRVLAALSPCIEESTTRWHDEDFCAWPGIDCHSDGESGRVGVAVTVTQQRRFTLPTNVNVGDVRITTLKVRANALATDSEFFESLAAVTSSSLTVLDMTGSNITSELPVVWGNIRSLQYLRLANNRFYGSLPSAWSALTDLREFQLQNNNVSGPLPSSWSMMTQLQTFTADNNSLSGTLPDAWQSMTSLSILSLKGNRVCGGVPASWNALTSLTLRADAMLYGSCTPSHSSGADSASSLSSSSEHPHPGEDSSRATASPTSTPPTPAPTTTPEPPAVYTNCTTANCVLCSVAMPSRCSACWPGYSLTVSRSCEWTGRNMALGPRTVTWQGWTLCLTLLAAVGGVW